jgi:hypothetical protein
MRYCHVAIGAGMLCLILCWRDAPVTGQTQSNSVYDGILVKVDRTELRMRRFSDQREYPRFKVSRTVTVTLNGRMSRREDLMEGDRLQITVENEKGSANREVVRIEAKRR